MPRSNRASAFAPRTKREGPSENPAWGPVPDREANNLSEFCVMGSVCGGGIRRAASYELLRRLKARTTPPISMNAKVAGSGTSSIVKACS
jgi:hypothetical protein